VEDMSTSTTQSLALMSLATLDPDRARESFNLRYCGALWAAHAAAPHLMDVHTSAAPPLVA